MTRALRTPVVSDRAACGCGRDTLKGGAGSDVVFGDGGDDSLGGVGGDDALDGGAGSDVADGGGGIDQCMAEVTIRCELKSGMNPVRRVELTCRG